MNGFQSTAARKHLVFPVAGLSLLFACCGLASLAPAAEPCGDAGATAEFRVEKRGAWLEVPVSMGSSTYSFTLDTGASVFIFDDIALAGWITPTGDSLGVRTPGGDIPMKVCESGPMRLGPFHLGAQRGVIWPGLFKKSRESGVNARGMMGMTALRDKVFTIDFDEGVVRFSRTVPPGAGTPIPLLWKRGVPFAVAEIEGLGKEAFQIDTGDCSFGAGSLRNEVFLKLALNQQLRIVGSPQEISVSAAGRKHVVMGQLAWFSFGPFIHRGLIMDGDPATSRLGLGYLSRYTVTFDMPGSTMYLRPGKEYDRADRYDLSGLGIMQSGKDIIVRYVGSRSAGELAGLQRWDAILSVDGTPASEISLFEICRLFHTPGERRIVYQRILERYETKLVLADEKTPTTKEASESTAKGEESRGVLNLKYDVLPRR